MPAGGVGVVGSGVAEELLGPDVLRRMTAGECGEAGSAPTASGIEVRHETIPSRFTDEPVEASIARPLGARPGNPLPVCFRLPGRGAQG
jgi:hypothetical protein